MGHVYLVLLSCSAFAGYELKASATFAREKRSSHHEHQHSPPEVRDSAEILPMLLEPEQPGQTGKIGTADCAKALAILLLVRTPALGWQRVHDSLSSAAACPCFVAKRHPPALLSIRTGPLVVALDFDGVLMDSEPELTRVAWRTCCSVWPELTDECSVTEGLMDESAYVERRRLGGQPLCGSADDGMPNWLWAKMRFLRPVMQSDADALLLVRLCMEEALSGDPEMRLFTVGEITSNWNPEFTETLYTRHGLSERRAAEACSKMRAAWFDGEPAEWAAAHKQYKAVMYDLREAARPSLLSKPLLYILTNRDPRYVRELLNRQRVEIADDSILISTPESKAETLAMLRQRHSKALLRFIDDDAYTLRSVARDPRLFSLKLFFASWGYCGDDDQAYVASMPRVRTLVSSRDLETVFHMPRTDGLSFRISM